MTRSDPAEGADDPNDKARPDAAHDPASERTPDAARNDARRRVMRRATLYSVGFLVAGLLVALGGAALVAWLFSRGSLPFLETWLVLTIIIVLPGVLAAIWKMIRNR